MRTRKGMNPIGGLIFFAIVLVAVFYLVSGFLGAMTGASHDLDQLTNETHTINTSDLPETFTVDKVEAGVLEDSETLFNPATGDELSTDQYKVISYKDGKFNVTEYKPGSGEEKISITYYNKRVTSVSGKVQAGRQVWKAYDETTPYLAVLVLAGAIIWLSRS